SPGTYNQNTFYRLMAQLGTDSLPANRNKLNLNYDNVNRLGQIDPTLVAGFTNWTPIRFFTNAAALMLRRQFGDAVPLNRIPIYPTNLYAASVHRLLQLAANICDATTNGFPLVNGTNTIYAPSVFRPLFGADGKSIFISGYEEVTNNALGLLAQPWVDLNVPTNAAGAVFSAVQSNPRVNVHGVPWVIGAKKGLPNFNEFLLETTAYVTRRLDAHKPTPRDTNHVTYRQSYQFAIT